MVISMDTPTGAKRREHLNFEYTHIPGVCYSDIGSDDLAASKPMRHGPGTYLTAGPTLEDHKPGAARKIAIFQAHLNALQTIVAKSMHNTVVLEDDARLRVKPDEIDVAALPTDGPTFLAGRLVHPTSFAKDKAWQTGGGPQAIVASLKRGANAIDWTKYRVLGACAIYYPTPESAAAVLEAVQQAKYLTHFDIWLNRHKLPKHILYPSPFVWDDEEVTQNDTAHGLVVDYVQLPPTERRTMKKVARQNAKATNIGRKRKRCHDESVQHE